MTDKPKCPCGTELSVYVDPCKGVVWTAFCPECYEPGMPTGFGFTCEDAIQNYFEWFDALERNST